jgi:hypothetical protein
MRRIFALLILISPFVFVACGHSAEEAKTKCDLERTANTNCFTDATYDSCLECYESCGTDCAVAESCPVQYICPE